AALKAHVELNSVANRVELVHAAVGAQDGTVSFAAGRGMESHIIHGASTQHSTQPVRRVGFYAVVSYKHFDPFKIYVEGSEEEVLKGGINLLSDSRRSPRILYIEVHPYAWPAIGTSSASLLSLLARCSYRVLGLDGQPVQHIESWGEVIAHKVKR